MRRLPVAVSYLAAELAVIAVVCPLLSPFFIAADAGRCPIAHALAGTSRLPARASDAIGFRVGHSRAL